MEVWEQSYHKWKSFPSLEEGLKEQLSNMTEIEIKEAFYKSLSFGTGGMRGILGPGRDRMNIYTVRKAAAGLANYLLKAHGEKERISVVIAYDSRHMSREFALESAKVFGVKGIHTYIFSKLQPTPLLSFAVRQLKTTAGIMITASHNPPEYNGLKVYNQDGGQLPLEPSEAVISEVNAIADELRIPTLSKTELEERGLLHWLDEDVTGEYLQALKEMTFLSEAEREEKKDLPIVFTPLHGTAAELVKRGLEQLNFTKLDLVEEQAIPDANFSTVQSPNPEVREAFSQAISLGEETGASLLLATDPDADRLGVAVRNKQGEYELLTGNQTGSLLLDYILRQRSKESLENGRLLKTIVTTELSEKIAARHGVETINTLTGFKFIAEKIQEFESTGERFIFGFEESYGYLIDSFARDKDGVQTAVMVAEMAYYWERQGKTLLDALEAIYEEHGYYFEGIYQVTLEGLSGAEKIQHIMSKIREQPLTEIAGERVLVFEDYLQQKWTNFETGEEGTISLPKENVLKFLLDRNQWVCFRPSGTEPKIKCYYGVNSPSAEESQGALSRMEAAIKALLDEE